MRLETTMTVTRIVTAQGQRPVMTTLERTKFRTIPGGVRRATIAVQAVQDDALELLGAREPALQTLPEVLEQTLPELTITVQTVQQIQIRQLLELEEREELLQVEQQVAQLVQLEALQQWQTRRVRRPATSQLEMRTITTRRRTSLTVTILQLRSRMAFRTT